MLSQQDDEGYATLESDGSPLSNVNHASTTKGIPHGVQYGEASTETGKPGKDVVLETVSTRSLNSSTESLNNFKGSSTHQPSINSLSIPTYSASKHDPVSNASPLHYARNWDLAQRLLSFEAINMMIQPPLTALTLAISAFLARTDKSGRGCYACAHCNLVIGEFPDGCWNNPTAFHRSISPYCSFFSETSNQEKSNQPKTQHGNQDQGQFCSWHKKIFSCKINYNFQIKVSF